MENQIPGNIEDLEQISQKEEDTSSYLRFKVIILGDTSCGKSTFFSQAIYNESFLFTDHTIGIEYGERKVKFQNRSFILELWDMKMVSNFDDYPDYFISDAIGAFVIYDTTKAGSFKQALFTAKMLKSSSNFVKNVVLLGNKIDLENLKAVKIQDLRDFCEIEEVLGIEISALKGVSVDKSLSLMTKGILKLIKKVKGFIPYPENYVLVDNKKSVKKIDKGKNGGRRCQLI